MCAVGWVCDNAGKCMDDNKYGWVVMKMDELMDGN